VSQQIDLGVVEINGRKYSPVVEGQEIPKGNRAVVVVDRGWIFAGDIEDIGEAIRLTRAVWVFRWDSVGFDGVIKNPKDSRVTLKPMVQPVEVPKGSEIFRVPVPAGWGL
jgi:hypothetical protein